jgi:hypothetical protein
MNYADAVNRHRYQAEEARAKGELMGDEATREQYFRMADAYDTLADNEERAAANAALAAKPPKAAE